MSSVVTGEVEVLIGSSNNLCPDCVDGPGSVGGSEFCFKGWLDLFDQCSVIICNLLLRESAHHFSECLFVKKDMYNQREFCFILIVSIIQFL